MEQVFEGVSLSPQQKLAFDKRNEGTNDTYNVFELKLAGELNSNQLKIALEQLLLRHEILRSEFVKSSGLVYPLQQVAKSKNHLAWQHHELVDGAKADLSKDLLPETTLDNEACCRAALLAVSTIEHRLLIHLPALTFDTYTFDAFAKQLSELYHKGGNGEELGEDTTQYAQFALWLDELAEDDDAKSYQDFFSGLELEQLPLGQLAYRKQGDAQRRARVESSLPAELRSKLVDFAASKELDLEQVLLASWACLHARLNDKERFLINWHHDCRQDYEELEDSLGLFSKALPFAVAVDLSKDFRTNLSAIASVAGQYLEAQEYWPANHELSQRPQISGFEFVKVQGQDAAGQLKFDVIEPPTKRISELHLLARDTGAGITLTLDFASNCYHEMQIQWLLNQFHSLLDAVMANDAVVLSGIELVSGAEREVLTQQEGPQRKWEHQDLLQLFRQNSAGASEKTALKHGEQEYTYAELDKLSDRLAYELDSLSIAGKPVGIYLPRCVESVIAILAAWKAGSPYLPLDVSWPEQRITDVLADAGAGALVSFSEQVLNSELTRIDLDTLSRETVTTDLQNEPSELAYLLYTSGSTGKPKGVKISHRNLNNYTLAACEQMQLSDYQSFALTATLAADLGNTMLFSALASGACLHVLSQDQVTDANEFAKYISEHSVDVVKLVPSHLVALLSADKPEQVLPSKLLILGGEASDVQLVQKISNMSADLTIFNHYGPTETTVGVLTHKYDPQADYGDTLPLDGVLANNRVIVLNEDGNLAASGEKGELYISGLNVAKGYLNNSKATETSFVELPAFSGEMYYKTGDLARYIPGLGLELTGRSDHQLKIRGYRVELSEIEMVLRQLGGVKQAVVAPFGEASLVKLCAYIVVDSESVKLDEIKHQLSERLPDYMLPHHIHTMSVLPLLANGKIDRKQLPPLDSLLQQAREVVPPENEIEEMLSAIWKSVLGVEEVGVTWDFFEMGGHSLMAIKVVSRIRKLLQVELPPGIMFEHGNIRALARAAVQFESAPGHLLAVAKARKQLAMQSQQKTVEQAK